MKAALSNDAMKNRVKKLREEQKIKIKDVKNLHVKLQKGNRKTGKDCYTVSLLPVIDCGNCAKCKHNCYDLKADLIYPAVIADRSKNSAIHKKEPDRFWREINDQVKRLNVKQLRINVGGDLNYYDFSYVRVLGLENPGTDILFFTKNYDDINRYLDEVSFPVNIHPIMSAWEGMKMENRHNLPCSHVLYEDGRTTAPEYGAVYCGGNCSECHQDGNGCWNLKKGEHVIFRAH